MTEPGNKPKDSTTGLILFGHGARDARWREPFDRLLALVEERYSGPVSLAFLDSMSPDLVSGCKELAARGAERVVVVPVFLGTGGHVRADLPVLVETARRETGVPVTAVDVIGEDERVLLAMAEYCLRSGS
ncbi:MAG: CbiX/SirB N-terminal domain-containing protein [Betaproteobacteria bacterium]|nr:MAG: CbiX/SirB N-terminal domain-containing protein [Betaproteobacteria bacterium]